jgi:hypothetical protein
MRGAGAIGSEYDVKPKTAGSIDSASTANWGEEGDDFAASIAWLMTGLGRPMTKSQIAPMIKQLLTKRLSTNTGARRTLLHYAATMMRGLPLDGAALRAKCAAPAAA